MFNPLCTTRSGSTSSSSDGTLSRLVEVNYCSIDAEGFVNPAVKFVIDVTSRLDEPLLQSLVASVPAYIEDSKPHRALMQDDLELKYYEEHSNKVSLLGDLLLFHFVVLFLCLFVCCRPN